MRILVFQIIGTVLYCLHYGLLGAWSGLFICACETLFDFGYYKTDKDKYIYMASVPIRIIGGLFGFSSVIDILPITQEGEFDLSALVEDSCIKVDKNASIWDALKVMLKDCVTSIKLD